MNKLGQGICPTCNTWKGSLWVEGNRVVAPCRSCREPKVEKRKVTRQKYKHRNFYQRVDTQPA